MTTLRRRASRSFSKRVALALAWSSFRLQNAPSPQFKSSHVQLSRELLVFRKLNLRGLPTLHMAAGWVVRMGFDPQLQQLTLLRSWSGKVRRNSSYNLQGKDHEVSVVGLDANPGAKGFLSLEAGEGLVVQLDEHTMGRALTEHDILKLVDCCI